MEDRPTVQMDSYESDDDEWSQADTAATSPTVPIKDANRQSQWQEAPPPPPYSESPAQAPYQPPAPPASFSPPPVRPEPTGATRLMGRSPRESLLAWLAVVEGPGAPRGTVFTLQPETLIGRSSGQVQLAGDAYVSGQHAKIRQEPSEEDEDKQILVLYDLASANGTFAGDRSDYKDQQVYRHELQDGDFLLIGETTLVFKQV